MSRYLFWVLIKFKTSIKSQEPCSWRGVLDTTLYDKVCQWPATGWWFSLGTPSMKLPQYNWNIVERGVKQQNPNPKISEGNKMQMKSV